MFSRHNRLRKLFILASFASGLLLTGCGKSTGPEVPKANAPSSDGSPAPIGSVGPVVNSSTNSAKVQFNQTVPADSFDGDRTETEVRVEPRVPVGR